MAAQKILTCYPDYGKIPPEYVSNLIDLLKTYDEAMLVRLCDIRTGIVSKCKFPPVPADIVVWCQAELFAAERELERQAIEFEEERRREWWRGREAKLVIAKQTYPDAFLLPDGTLARPRTEEYRPGAPLPKIERPTGAEVSGLKPLSALTKALISGKSNPQFSQPVDTHVSDPLPTPSPTEKAA